MFLERPESRQETDKKLNTIEAIAASSNTPNILGKVALGFAVIRRSVLGAGDQIAAWSNRMLEKSREADEISQQRLENTRNKIANVLAMRDVAIMVDKFEDDFPYQASDALSQVETIIESEAERIQTEQA